ncbi:Tyrosine-protein kinase transmembrane receptor Ror [Gryllus bimaculatus]|nr:Tyrosine-protein kinase transmembrane receptor Ror [Gryllus bimaculatus]
MEQMKTPVSKKNPAFNRLLKNTIEIPGSPAMPCIGMGSGVNVYSFARSPMGGQARSPWAIKKINRKTTAPEYESRLLAEVDVLRNLKHPNIVGFRAVVESKDGHKCLAMEECETSLGDLIEERGETSKEPFAVDNILTVASDICKALSYLHDECLLLHGDLKSFNVLIRGNFEVAKLCDFGVTVRVNTKGVALPDQYYVGTEIWSAPEVLENDGAGVTTKADIFSYGLVLWEMLSLRPPHTPEEIPDDPSGNDGSTCEESFFGELGTRPELPTGLSSVYDEVIYIFNWCCEAEPDARPSAIQIQDFLQASKMQ